MDARLTPYELAFGPIAAERFPALRTGLAAAGRNPRNRDEFVLVKEVVELLRELRPEGSEGDGVAELVALCHAAYLHWLDEEAVVSVDRDGLAALVRGLPPASRALARSFYLELPVGRVWGAAGPDSTLEPLDGCFVLPREDGLDAVAVFGVQPGRPGFTVVATSGPRRLKLVRLDATALFSARFEGGAAAGLTELAGEEELLDLVYRAMDLLPAAGAAPGRQTASYA